MPSFPDRHLGNAHRVDTDEHLRANIKPCHPDGSSRSTCLIRHHSCDSFFPGNGGVKSVNGRPACSDTASIQSTDETALDSNVKLDSTTRHQGFDLPPLVTGNGCSTPLDNLDQSTSSTVNISPGLLRLFESSIFTIDLALKYLFEKNDLCVQAYLTKRLFRFPAHEVDFYLLQLVSLYHNSQVLAEHLYPYFLYRCSRSIEFALHLIWLLDTFSPCLRRECSLRRTASTVLALQSRPSLQPANSSSPSSSIASVCYPRTGGQQLLTHSASDAAFRGKTAALLQPACGSGGGMISDRAESVPRSVAELRTTLLPVGDQQLMLLLQMADARRHTQWPPNHQHQCDPTRDGGVRLSLGIPVAAQPVVNGNSTPASRHKRAVSDLTTLATCYSQPRRHARVLSIDLASEGGQGRGGNVQGGQSLATNQTNVVLSQPRSLSSSSFASRDSAVGMLREDDVHRKEEHSDSDHSIGAGGSPLPLNLGSLTSSTGQVHSDRLAPVKVGDSKGMSTSTCQPLPSNPTTTTSSPSDSGLNMVTPGDSIDPVTPPLIGHRSEQTPREPQQRHQAALGDLRSEIWLTADRRLDLQLHLVPKILPQWEFVDGLMRLARRLVPITAKEQRTAYLQAELANINLNLPARVWLPVTKADHVVLRIPPTAAVCLNSKDKAPFLVYCEVLDCQDPWTVSLPQRSTSGSLRLRPNDRDRMTLSVGGEGRHASARTSTSLTCLSHHHSNHSHWQSPVTLSSSHSSTGDSLTEGDADSLISSTMETLDVIASSIPSSRPCADDSLPIHDSSLQLHDGTILGTANQSQGHAREDQQPIYVSAGEIRDRLKRWSEHQPHRSFKTDPEDPSAAVLKEPWTVKCERIRSYSPWGHLPGWRLTSAIVKVGDDLRQEQLAYQLLSLLQRIWSAEYIPLWLHPLTVVVTSPDCGLIEPVPDAVSLHQIHRHARLSLVDYLLREHGGGNSEAFLQAQKNFVQSCAAYCLVGYLLQVKDRHNGNILLDSHGHMIHIDYGFILSASPGKNFGFEKSPFKLTPEQVTVMGGTGSDLFEYFKCLLLKGLLAARKHMDEICLLVEIAWQTCPGLPCFSSGGQETISRLRQRFMRSRVEGLIQQRVNSMVEESLHSVTTKLYDSFQYYTNGIQY